jgi:SOS-response transcriptional repressor LexA
LIALLTLLNVPPTGIFPGDIAVVDRRKTAGVRSIVLAILDGEFT